jgi:two-component system response regulator HupR/HoxA
VLSDHIMPGLSGTELLARVHRRWPRRLKVLLTGQADAESVGVAVNEADLYRYIAKPWNEDDQVLTVREAVRRYSHELTLDEKNAALEAALAELRRLKDRFEAENVYLREEIAETHGFEHIIGQSAGLAQVLDAVARVAPSDAPVLVLGESGTGKELVARAVHEASARRRRALVKVNCAALSPRASSRASCSGTSAAPLPVL